MVPITAPWYTADAFFSTRISFAAAIADGGMLLAGGGAAFCAAAGAGAFCAGAGAFCGACAIAVPAVAARAINAAVTATDSLLIDRLLRSAARRPLDNSHTRRIGENNLARQADKKPVFDHARNAVQC